MFFSKGTSALSAVTEVTRHIQGRQVTKAIVSGKIKPRCEVKPPRLGPRTPPDLGRY
jgi:hypothetical protein